jgi:hypothetical protein
MRDLQGAVDAALHSAYAQDAPSATGALVGEWVLTAETYGDDGEPYLHTLRSSGMTAWKALGMLEAHSGDLRHAMLGDAGA